MMSVDLRAVTVEDAEPIRVIWQEAVTAGMLDGFNASDVDMLVDRLPIHPEGIFVAVSEGDVAGFLHADAHLLVVQSENRRMGIGRKLVDFAERSLIESTGERLLLWLPDGVEGAAAFYSSLGMRHSGSLWQLNLSPERYVPPPVLPEGIEARSIDEVDLDEYVRLFNTAFAGHPTPLQITREIVDWAKSRPGYDPSMTLVLAERSSGKLIGMCRSAHDHGPGEAGEVKFIGLLPEWRGKGLGKALLAWGVHRVAAAGAIGAQLNVEGENDGPLALYEQMGFVRAREWRRFGR